MNEENRELEVKTVIGAESDGSGTKTVHYSDGSEETTESSAENVDELAEEVKAETSVEKKLGTKEIEEVLVCLDVVGNFVAKVFADGQVNGADFGHIMGLIRNFDSFANALEGVDQLDDELKDLDSEEALILGIKAVAIVKKIVKATKASKL